MFGPTSRSTAGVVHDIAAGSVSLSPLVRFSTVIVPTTCILFVPDTGWVVTLYVTVDAKFVMFTNGASVPEPPRVITTRSLSSTPNSFVPVTSIVLGPTSRSTAGVVHDIAAGSVSVSPLVRFSTVIVPTTCILFVPDTGWVVTL